MVVETPEGDSERCVEGALEEDGRDDDCEPQRSVRLIGET